MEMAYGWVVYVAMTAAHVRKSECTKSPCAPKAFYIKNFNLLMPHARALVRIKMVHIVKLFIYADAPRIRICIDFSLEHKKKIPPM